MADASGMPPDICERFGQRVRKLRNERGWTQADLAHRTGSAQTSISEMENGHEEPCLRRIEELAQAFEITVSQLMKGV